MIRGITATVLVPSASAADRFNDQIYGEPAEVEVGNVLVSPGQAAELDATRPEGARVALTLHFPKTFAGDLRGCEVELPEPYAGKYRVVGEPYPYIGANTPTMWHMPVEVEAVHG